MRPKSITYFEILSILGLAIAAAITVSTFGGSIPGLPRGANGTPVLLLASVIVAALFLLLILLTSRRASNVARWILVVLVVGSVAGSLLRIGEMLGGGALGLAELLSLVLQVAAIYFLFTADSRRWFAERRDGSAPGASGA